MRRKLSKQANDFAHLHQRLANDIYEFARACNFEPTFQQAQLLDAVQNAVLGDGNPRIAVKSGQGPGKTVTSGIVGLWLLMREPYTKLIVTAPTMRQCYDVWLAEVRQTLRRASPAVANIFNLTNTGIGVLGGRSEDRKSVV